MFRLFIFSAHCAFCVARLDNSIGRWHAARVLKLLVGKSFYVDMGHHAHMIYETEKLSYTQNSED